MGLDWGGVGRDADVPTLQHFDWRDSTCARFD